MTYLQFHLVFLLPPLAVLGVVAALRRRRGAAVQDPAWAFWLLPVIALVYTTPWDNYLVWREVWLYGRERVVGTIGYVPVEEYLFFLLQPILAGLWYRLVRSWTPDTSQDVIASGAKQSRWVGPGPARLRPRLRGDRSVSRNDKGAEAARWWGAASFGVLTLVGVALVVMDGHGLYLGLILAWASPVLAGMWGIAGAKLWRARRTLVLAILPPSLYLWIADRVALGEGIWAIADATRTGAEMFGLPVEEALFFLVTNGLVVQGLAMFATEGPDVPAAERRPGAIGAINRL